MKSVSVFRNTGSLSSPHAAPQQTWLSSPPHLVGPGAARLSGSLMPTQERDVPEALGTNHLASESDPWTLGFQPDLRGMALSLHFPYTPASVLAFHSRGWHFLGPETHPISNRFSAWSWFFYLPPHPCSLHTTSLTGNFLPTVVPSWLRLPVAAKSWVYVLSLRAQVQHP